MIRNEIDLYLNSCGGHNAPCVQQYDMKSRLFACRLWREPGVPYVLDEGARVGVVYKWRGMSPSKEYDTELENESTVLCLIPDEATQRFGPVTMQLILHENGGALHGPEIAFMVLKSLKPGDGESDEPVLMLIELVSEATELLDRLEHAVENGEFSGPPGPAGKITRVQATVDSRPGKPSVSVGYGGTQSELELYLNFKGLRGVDGQSPRLTRGEGWDEDGTPYTTLLFETASGSEEIILRDGKKGEQGPAGPAGKIKRVYATVNNAFGKPSVNVGYAGTEEELEIYLDFYNLKGNPGEKGADGQSAQVSLRRLDNGVMIVAQNGDMVESQIVFDGAAHSYGTENAGTLLCVGSDGKAVPVALGAGLAVVDGVLTLTGQ